MDINLDNYPKAKLALEYRPDLKPKLEELISLHQSQQVFLIEAVENDPKISIASLNELVIERAAPAAPPFDGNARANQLYLALRDFSHSAANEFKETIDTLGDSVDLESTAEKIRSKHLSSPDANIRIPHDANKYELMRKYHVTFENNKYQTANNKRFENINAALEEAIKIYLPPPIADSDKPKKSFDWRFWIGAAAILLLTKVVGFLGVLSLLIGWWVFLDHSEKSGFGIGLALGILSAFFSFLISWQLLSALIY